MAVVFFFQAEDGIRDLVRSRGLGDVYKRQQYLVMTFIEGMNLAEMLAVRGKQSPADVMMWLGQVCDALTYLHSQNPPIIHRDIKTCLLYTSDAADERSSVDLGGRRILKKKTQQLYIQSEN